MAGVAEVVAVTASSMVERVALAAGVRVDEVIRSIPQQALMAVAAAVAARLMALLTMELSVDPAL